MPLPALPLIELTQGGLSLVWIGAVAVSAVHVGVQWVVHLVVYPALADSASGPAAATAQLRHTRRMGVAIAPVYGLLVLSTAALLTVGLAAGGVTAVLASLAAALALAVLAVTGLVAVPLHRALSEAAHPADALHRRLARTDLVRLVLAALHLAAVTLFASVSG